MGILIKYALLGVSLAAPIGPVNAAQMDKGMRFGFWHAWLLGLGATTADAVYMFFVYMGLVGFLDIPLIKAFLWLFGCFVLLYTGIESMQTTALPEVGDQRQHEKKLRCFFVGFFMSLTNPLTILFWIGIYGAVLAETVSRYETSQLIVYSAAIYAGILLWDFFMALVASTFRKVVPDRFVLLISKLSGLTLICFGFYFGYQAIQLFIH
ncbi:translocator protein, LysE family [Fictibacillus macauensis ZFHKF-1]|uniref:Translocator protein, LysE family n=1 Tax=Fictibacillus macauensis ZFHKF-1 TaxID=1196324 RepID=I8AL71_9BACL|nr:LysE family transporter [Fictibacillus macauensis]EIT86359.1 translocator protein, LysE family [Fictibacillus macauensis ZFHKF-1]